MLTNRGGGAVDAIRDWVPAKSKCLKFAFKTVSRARRPAIRCPSARRRPGGGPVPAVRGPRYVLGGSGGAAPAPVVTDRLRRSAQKLLERLARVVEPIRMLPGAYNFWR